MHLYYLKSKSNRGEVREILILIVSVSVLLGAVFYYLKSVLPSNQSLSPTVEENNNTAPQINNASKDAAVLPPQKNIAVNADKNRLTPNIFEIKHLDDVVLIVTAIDREYTIKISGSNQKYTVKKNAGYEIAIGGLSVGNHDINCGSGCSGIVRVIGDRDPDVKSQ